MKLSDIVYNSLLRSVTDWTRRAYNTLRAISHEQKSYVWKGDAPPVFKCKMVGTATEWIDTTAVTALKDFGRHFLPLKFER
jgi:hypothetical protein